jgi:hypothetical protein
MVTSLWHEERMLIGGKLVKATDDAAFENVNPAAEEVIGWAANGSSADLDAAIGAARVAFDQRDWPTNVPLRAPHVIAEDSASGSPFVDVTVLHNFGRNDFRIHYTIFN